MQAYAVRVAGCSLLLLWAAGCGSKTEPDEAPPPPTEAEAFPLELLARQFETAWLAPGWDQLRRDDHRLTSFLTVLPDSVQLPNLGAPSNLTHGIVSTPLVPGGDVAPPGQLKTLCADWEQAGVKVHHSDWHQESILRVGDAYESTVRGNIHAVVGNRRVQIKGHFAVTWHPDRPEAPRELRWIKGHMSERSGPLAFSRVATIATGNRVPGARMSLGGLAVYDLDADALPDIVLANANMRFMNRGNFQFEKFPLCSALAQTNDSLQVVVFGDFDGDRNTDLVANRTNGDLVWFRGDGTGDFPGRPQPLTDPVLNMPTLTCLTAGDIDGDADLDLFGGQWLSPYERIPDSYWNALDGPTNVLLRNEGDGRFTDITASSGLAQKSGRRTYSASLVDLDLDLDLDLLVVSDFSGVDLYLNDGRGNFSDVTEEQLPPLKERVTFGMSHSITDIDLDGTLDLFVTGMGSTTARRLERMESAAPDPMRGPMGYGNRLFLRSQGQRYVTAPFADSVARTGWSWGSSSFDIDNDSDPDIYVVNGHISGETAHDYCSYFWCSDIRQPQLQSIDSVNAYLDRLSGLQTMSWDGFQPNALLINQGPAGFTEAGFLLDLGFPHDARCLVTADLNVDGWMDVVLTTSGGTTGFEHVDREGLAPAGCLVFQNQGLFGRTNKWIGVKIGTGKKLRAHGVRVDIVAIEEGKERLYRNVIVSGESYMSQHPASVHVGLGQASAVARIDITWPGGQSKTISSPAMNQWHALGKGPPR